LHGVLPKCAAKAGRLFWDIRCNAPIADIRAFADVAAAATALRYRGGKQIDRVPHHLPKVLAKIRSDCKRTTLKS